ncbi:MAG: glycosyltransferase family 61 protein [Calothrix sp. MO_192.B10]|nr:glycosyltransferase family 61 protein [Calothrix sp. MO_192.B10]
MTGKRPRGSIQLTIDNVDKILGDRKDIKFFKIVEEEDVEIKPARCLEEDYLINFQPFKVRGEYVLLDINNREFSFRNNHLFDNNLNVIYEPQIEFSQLTISKQSLSRCKKIKGTVAYISNTVPNHYGHWLQYTLPLIRIYWKNIGKQNIDYYYIGDCPISNFQIETLTKLGIDRQQIINYPCKADCSLIALRYKIRQNGGSQYTDIFTFRFLRELFPISQNSSNNHAYKKIYVPRGNVSKRKVINENEILNYLDKLGFLPLVMDGRTVQEQADIFSNADVIIAPHGSALHNLIFARPNTKVIELYSFNHFDTTNFTFASYANTDYYYVIGEKVSPDHISPVHADIKIDISKLERICKLANLV